MIVEKGEWQVPLENSEKHMNVWHKLLAFVKANRDQWHVTISWVYSYQEKDTSVENWMYIDEYDSEDSYKKGREALQIALESEEGKPLFAEFNSLRVEDSFKVTRWTENQALRVD